MQYHWLEMDKSLKFTLLFQIRRYLQGSILAYLFIVKNPMSAEIVRSIA
jgi:hypothetical protein